MNIQTKRKLAGWATVCVALMIFLALALRRQTGLLGKHAGDPLENHLGYCAYFLPFAGSLAGLWLLRGESLVGYLGVLGGYFLLALSVITLLGVLPPPHSLLWAGDLGIELDGAILRLVGLPGLLVVAIFVAVVGGWAVRGDPLAVNVVGLLRKAWRGVAGSCRQAGSRFRAWRARRALRSPPRVTVPAVVPPVVAVPPDAGVEGEENAVGSVFSEDAIGPPSPGGETAPEPAAVAEGAEGGASGPAAGQKRHRKRRPAGRWKLPPLDLLDVDSGGASADSLQGWVDGQLRVIDQTLAAFKVDGRVVSVTRGARVILFEWAPAPGVKASRLEGLADDLTLAMKAERVRVVVPLPGKGTVGIEVAHPAPASVTLGGLLAARPAGATAGDLPLALGRALTGEPLFADLVGMPHLLIAGTTGSGKSVCIHTVLMSLMMARTPEELRLMLIDPKRVELIAYRRSPHLLCEVITDAKRAVAALRWVVGVMEERYRLLAHYGCRDLTVFNRMVREEEEEIDLEGARNAVLSASGLPWIVIGVDELADLMVARPREVEDGLQRLAQMARGVGIHLVVATQRPSVDVLTGVIKANLPSRLSFQVATRVDSRTILDTGGAEQLLGRGDMLFSPAGAAAPQRAQAAFVSTAEVARILDFWGVQGSPEMMTEEGGEESWPALEKGTEEDDPLYDEAVNLVVQTGEASVSQLQRRLSIGFARAGRLVDLMERRGVVGPKQGSKAREILMERPPGIDSP